MGANTYRLMSGLATDGEPGTDALADLSKIVFSTTLTEPLAWPNTRLISRDPIDTVRSMKDTGTESMRTIGSLMLCRSLLRAGLVDRFRVVVFPVITGSTGKDRIYDGYPDVSLDMVSGRVFDDRLQLLSTSLRFWLGHPVPVHDSRSSACRQPDRLGHRSGGHDRTRKAVAAAVHELAAARNACRWCGLSTTTASMVLMVSGRCPNCSTGAAN